MIDQADKLRRLSGSSVFRSAVPVDRKARVVAITSGKGGVGKTNIAVNITIALAAKGKRVVIIDADIGLANVDVIMGVSPKYDLSTVLRGEKNIRDIITQGPGGVGFIAGGVVNKDLLDIRDWQIDRLAVGFSELDNIYDVIIIDTGAGVSQHVMSFVLAAPEVIVVTTQEPTSIADAYRMLKAISLKESGSVNRLVVNRATSAQDAKNTFNRLNRVSNQYLKMPLNYLGYLSDDSAVSASVMRQSPFLIEFPESMAAVDIQRLADNLSMGAPQGGGFKGFFSKMTKMFN
jgi:flagellar biosynthesis protein FlhG